MSSERGQHLGDFGLADAGLALEEQRPLEPKRQIESRPTGCARRRTVRARAPLAARRIDGGTVSGSRLCALGAVRRGRQCPVTYRPTSVVDHAGRRPDPEASYHYRSSLTPRSQRVLKAAKSMRANEAFGGLQDSAPPEAGPDQHCHERGGAAPLGILKRSLARMKLPMFVGTVALLTAVPLTVLAQEGVNPRPPNAPDAEARGCRPDRAPERKSNVAFDVVTVAEGLQNPWALAFLPDGRMLVTEAGPAAHRHADGTLSAPVAGLPEVDAAVRAGCSASRSIPISRRTGSSTGATPSRGTATTTRRWRAGASWTMPRRRGRQRAGDLPPGAVAQFDAALRQPPRVRARRHVVRDAGRTIDHGRAHAGAEDGQPARQGRPHQRRRPIPKDNPFVGKAGVRPEIWSIGHRNVQAATLHPTTGELWEVEHGTRGGDELNIARKGKDYGWPTIAYGIEYNGGRSPAATGRRPAWSSRSITGIRHRAERHDVLHRHAVPGLEGSLFIGGHRHATSGPADARGEKVVGKSGC